MLVDFPQYWEGTMIKRFEGADGIRGLACLIVLLLHSVFTFFRATYESIVGMPKFGVWLFFVLSAFLLTRKFMSTGFSPVAVCEYALGRFLRIIPLFVLVVFAFWYLHVVGIFSFADVKSAILFEKGYVHLWTIPVEFKFYAVLPFIAFGLTYTRVRLGWLAAVAIAAVVLVAHQAFWGYWKTPEPTIDTIWYLPCFLMGSVAAIAYEPTRRLVSAGSANGVAAVTAVVLLLLSNPARFWLFDMPMDQWLLNKFLFLGAIWGGFLLFLIDGHGTIGAFLKTTAMRKLGQWSYSIYLVHWVFIEKLFPKYPNSLLMMLVCLALSIATGAVLYYLIESPIERFRHKINLGRKSRIATA